MYKQQRDHFYSVDMSVQAVTQRLRLACGAPCRAPAGAPTDSMPLGAARLLAGELPSERRRVGSTRALG